jgi:hypothetical protein
MSLFEELQSALQILVAPKLEAIIVRLDGMDKRLEITEKRIDRVEERLDRLEIRAERRHDELIAQQQRFRHDILNEIRTAINFKRLRPA